MPTFLEAASCEGRRPKHLASLRCYSRPDLIARLLRDRQVARFVVAPDGFGKTSLAFGYADTVFSFQHVAWLNGRSPCFLRDLDAGVIAAGLRAADEKVALAVMDDLPPLGPERAAALSAQMDELLAAGCEVLACCAPSCDAFSALQRDRLKLDSADLLLADDELALGAHPVPEGPVPPSSRVAALHWSEGSAAPAFLEGVAREELPADLVLAMAVMLALREGALEELSAFGELGDETLQILAQSYPFLGIDERRGSFSCPPFEAAAIARAFGPKLDAAAARSAFPDKAALACGLADALLERDEGRRACELVGLLCPRPQRAAWLEARAVELARRCCLLPARDLAHLAGRGAQRSARAEGDEAWRAALLGDVAEALRAARRAAVSNAAEPQVLGLLVLARCGQANEAARAAERLEGWAAAPRPGGDDEAARRFNARLAPLAALQGLAAQPVDQARERWAAWSGQAHPDALCLAAKWLFEDACSLAQRQAGEGAAGRASAARDGLLLARAAQAVEDALQSAGASAFPALAFLAWEELRRVEGRPLRDAGSPLAVRARRFGALLAVQRAELARRTRARDARRAEAAAGNPAAFLDGRYRPAPVSADAGAPLLTVNLFGGMDVRIGSVPVDASKLRRQKVKALLALLVLNRGRDFSRDRLIALIWPGSDAVTARKNFYSIWSRLRAALSLPSGACPYLVRQQNVCRLEGSLLRTDVAEFDQVCRTLLFGALDTDGWARLSSEVQERFADDLLPGERGTDAIARMRAECRARLVDALVAAARRLVEAGSPQEGLWFARAALARDGSREDAYAALMRAQIAAGQRAAALETYFRCRRFLADELGIDPSVEVVSLYRSVIEAEEGLE